MTEGSIHAIPTDELEAELARRGAPARAPLTPEQAEREARARFNARLRRELGRPGPDGGEAGA